MTTMRVLVDKDWDSSALWVPGRQGGWASADHHTFGLPPDLADRCDYLSAWFETYEPGSNSPEPDWGSYNAYLVALAIDLKRHFRDSAQVFSYRGNELAEVTGDFASMAKLVR